MLCPEIGTIVRIVKVGRMADAILRLLKIDPPDHGMLAIWLAGWSSLVVVDGKHRFRDVPF